MAKLKEFSCGIGISVEKSGGVWWKINSSVTIELENGDDSKKVKEMAWATVEDEVQKKMEEIE